MGGGDSERLSDAEWNRIFESKRKEALLDEARDPHRENKKHKVDFCDEYDAYYVIETGEWLEPKCKVKKCPFCVNRPKKKKK